MKWPGGKMGHFFENIQIIRNLAIIDILVRKLRIYFFGGKNSHFKKANCSENNRFGAKIQKTGVKLARKFKLFDLENGNCVYLICSSRMIFSKIRKSGTALLKK
jgi:hypothetical protein